MPRAKTGVKPKTIVKKTEKPVTKKAAKVTSGLSVPMYFLDGKDSGTLILPKELFGQKVNKKLLAQALRVYLNNTKSHFSNTKTRSEVKGSTRKIYRQKGTGGARHGAKKAPIFVGGGIALGPKFRKVVLDLPKKMKKAALISALSSKIQSQEIVGVKGLDKATGKTSQISSLLKSINGKNALLVIDGKQEMVERAARNLPDISVVRADQLNILDIIKNQTLILTKEAVERLESRIKKGEK